MFFEFTLALIWPLIKGVIALTGRLEDTAFPPPLTPQQESSFVQQMLDGDFEARQKLVEHNLRLVAHIVKKFDCREEEEDLIIIGAIGLIKAIDSFNPEKSVKLSTYAARCIENEILMDLRKKHKLSREMSLDAPISSDKDGNELHYADILGTDSKMIERTVEQTVIYNQVIKLFDVLNKREREVLGMRFGIFGYHRLTQNEVADKLGLSRSYISRIETKATNKLKKAWEMVRHQNYS